jgi:hypothetical protein
MGYKVRQRMAAPSLHVPGRTTLSDCGSGSVRVTLGDMIRAHRGTAEFLWAQRNRPAPVPETSALVTEAAASTPRATRASTALEGSHASAPSNDAGVTWSLRESASERRAQLKAEGWIFADDAASPLKAKGKKPTRYLPPDARFLTWVEARGGSAALSAIARRFNLTVAEVDVLVSRLTAAGLGLVLDNHGRGGGRRFVLLRTPRPATMAAL